MPDGRKAGYQKGLVITINKFLPQAAEAGVDPRLGSTLLIAEHRLCKGGRRQRFGAVSVPRGIDSPRGDVYGRAP